MTQLTATLAERPFGRRTMLVGAAGAAAALAGCKSPSASSGGPAASSSSAATAPVSYQLGWLPTVEWGGNWLADDKGYYTQQGVSFTWLPGGPNVTSETVVASGKALVGSSNADTIAKAISQGADLKIFGAAFQKNPFCVASRADQPITTPQEMVGKKIGVAAGNQTAFNLFLKINNIAESSLTVVPVQFDPTPLVNKEVDGQVVFAINEPTQLELKGIKTNVLLFADYGYNILADVFFATTDTLQTQAPALTAFLEATRHGYQDLITEPDTAADLATNKYGKGQGFNLDQQKLQAKSMKQLIVTDKVTTPLALPAEAIDANLKTIGLLGLSVTADQLFTTAILDGLS